MTDYDFQLQRNEEQIYLAAIPVEGFFYVRRRTNSWAKLGIVLADEF